MRRGVPWLVPANVILCTPGLSPAGNVIAPEVSPPEPTAKLPSERPGEWTVTLTFVLGSKPLKRNGTGAPGTSTIGSTRESATPFMMYVSTPPSDGAQASWLVCL